jgi:predicted nucleic acid-binding protein
LKVGRDSNVLVASVKKGGEPHHNSAVSLANEISKQDAVGVASALVLIEVPGALCSSTKMPVEKIYEVLASLQAHFKLRIAEFEAYADLAKELMFEFRGLKSKWEIGSADFHHIATSIAEGCDLFVTTDEKHMLREDCRKEFEKHIRIATPNQALRELCD